MPVLKPEGSSYNDVPDRIPPIGSGIYDFRVKKSTVMPNKDKTGNNIVIEAEIFTDNSPFKGREITRYIPIKNSSDSTQKRANKDVMLKQFAVACGVTEVEGGGYDTDHFVDKIFKGEIAPRTYQDQQGRQVETADLSNILRPDGSRF